MEKSSAKLFLRVSCLMSLTQKKPRTQSGAYIFNKTARYCAGFFDFSNGRSIPNCASTSFIPAVDAGVP